VHAHQGGTLSHECILHARTIGKVCVFTDHSLFGFGDVASIHANKVLQMTLMDAHKGICVTNVAKENTCLRAGLKVRKVAKRKNDSNSSSKNKIATKGGKKRKERDCYDDADDDVACNDSDYDYELYGFDPNKIDVIPNAVDAEAFHPYLLNEEDEDDNNNSDNSNNKNKKKRKVNKSSNNSTKQKDTKKKKKDKKNDTKVITIVVCSRLTYRKGIHLLAKLIPLVCALKNERVRFLIAGSGPMEPHLREVCENTHVDVCKGKVEFLGDARHEDVPNILRRGDIFLNCSLTEAFCTAIVEAASCGLLVVATAVGGVPEVLPGKTTISIDKERSKEIKSSFLAPPTVSGLFDKLKLAIELAKEIGQLERESIGSQILKTYSWSLVAKKTEALYVKALAEKEAASSSSSSSSDFANRLSEKFSKSGFVFGPLLCLVLACAKIHLNVLEFMEPAHSIELSAPVP